MDPKKVQKFVFWWFCVRLGLIYNTLKVGQIWTMGSVQFRRWLLSIFKSFPIYMWNCISVRFRDKSAKFAFYPGFQGQSFTWESYQWCWITPYTISRDTPTPSPCCTHPDSQTVMYVILFYPKKILHIIIFIIYHWIICHIVTPAILAMSACCGTL